MKGDAHGMAIKLLGVPGEKILDEEKDAQNQDFLLIDLPVFLIKNTKDHEPLGGINRPRKQVYQELLYWITRLCSRRVNCCWQHMGARSNY